ncbi:MULTISPECIES: hypothetical protein [unclassified Microcoleus]|uniref:hypothetical protein n=1 Tax=unclassified Microcoleus TaxID=2642155 RepID=UPI002FD5E872
MTLLQDVNFNRLSPDGWEFIPRRAVEVSIGPALSDSCAIPVGVEIEERTIASTGEIEADNILDRSDNLRFTAHNL